MPSSIPILTLIIWAVFQSLMPPHAFMQQPTHRAVTQPEQVRNVYGDTFAPQPYHSSDAFHTLQAYQITIQGNDSNCDFLAVANGIQNIGGDGIKAYWKARELVVQQPRDYKEAFYTLLGAQGSDQRFSLDNLGAAPEAFVGIYESMGYNAVMLATMPQTVDTVFAQAIYDRLTVQPTQAFAHLWITPGAYNAQARVIEVPETGEQVNLLYPYHEVAAMVTPDQPNHVVILDGLVGYPFTLNLSDLAWYVRGFNRVIVVSTSIGDLSAHQQAQQSVEGQPYVQPTLGGVFLQAARQTWGPAYQQWGQVIGQPFRISDAPDPTVALPGRYVWYERTAANAPTFTPLGSWMWQNLHQAGIIQSAPPEPGQEPPLVNGIQTWVVGQFGSEVQFTHAFGRVLSQEFWVSHEQMQTIILRGVPFPPVDAHPGQGYICVVTERSLLAWDPQQGVLVIPLGQIYLQYR